MCPDRELISAYYDGETDSKWSFNIKEHIESCTSCSESMNAVNDISRFLNNSEVPGESEIKDRVFDAIERKRTVIKYQPIWRKHFDVSFPVAAAAAAAMVVFLTTTLVIGLNSISKTEYMVEEIKDEPQKINAQVISIDDAAAYLLSDDSGFDVLITIPAGDGLSLTGEPQLIREADYKRSQ